MILIADAGSTKTDWSLIDKNLEVKFFQTHGYNPYFNDTETITSGLDSDIEQQFDRKAVKELHYYGAGCSTDNNCLTVSKAMNSLFPEAAVHISDDLTGAARSLLGNREGIACILGTGSNACYYDGRSIVERLPSYGYMFGDEGSGAHMGKKLIGDYLYEMMPEEIEIAFNEKYDLKLSDILEGVYKNPYPNRYLASFTSFLSENLNSDYIVDIISSSFSEFFDRQLIRFSAFGKTDIACVGSVSYYFKDIFSKVAIEYRVNVERYLKSPARGLLRYHCGVEI
jgi:glucosamine kinase